MKKRAVLQTGKPENFTACLDYLKREAEKENLPLVTCVLGNAIDQINDCTELQEGRRRSNDKGLHDTLQMIHSVAALPNSERTRFVELLKAFCVMFDSNGGRGSECSGLYQ
jgi:hypothetical protein